MTVSPSSSASSVAPQRRGEFDLLCALARTQLTPERIERIAEWNFFALNWSEFLRRAEDHGVLPLVARNLADHGFELPAGIESSLRSSYDANLKRSLWFAAELARIMHHFANQKLRAIPYKGPLLAQSVYRDVALRSFSDLDFLIAAGDFERAKRALREIGYVPSTEFPPAVERFWLCKGYERAFDGRAGKYLLELQWAVLPYFYAVDLKVEDLIARSGVDAIGGYEMPSLSAEDSLLALCLHAAKHLWTRLIWLVDIAESLRTQSIDYPLFFSRVQGLGIARLTGVSFWLVKHVLDAPLPQPADEWLTAELTAKDAGVAMLGQQFADRLARGATYNFESTDYFRWILKLRERPRDRQRYFWRLLWTPGTGDLAALQLPEAFFPFYRIVRIARLAKRLTRKLFS